MITNKQIEDAKKRVTYSHPPKDVVHEHDDCIRIAYDWLDAQVKRKTVNYRQGVSKHAIEQWGGRYVSVSDLEVAIELHSGVSGTYPHINVSSRWILPNDRRLAGIGQARTQGYALNRADYWAEEA